MNSLRYFFNIPGLFEKDVPAAKSLRDVAMTTREYSLPCVNSATMNIPNRSMFEVDNGKGKPTLFTPPNRYVEKCLAKCFSTYPIATRSETLAKVFY